MKKIELVLGFKCNCRCVFCVIDEEASEQSMETETAVRHLAQARKDGAVDVDFGGGEPTLRKDLPSLARTAAALGYRKIGVRSNGLLFCYPEFVEKLRLAGVNQFAVSIWGDSPNVHDSLCRVAGAFEMMEMGVKHIVDRGGDIEANVLLTEMSVRQLASLTRYFADIGVRRFRMSLFSLFASNQALPALLPTMTSAGKAIVDAAQAVRADEKVHISTTHVPFCFLRPYESLYSNAADTDLVIVTPGGSFPVENSPVEAGIKTDRCKGCSKYDSCAGLRPEYIRRFTDRELAPF